MGLNLHNLQPEDGSTATSKLNCIELLTYYDGRPTHIRLVTDEINGVHTNFVETYWGKKPQRYLWRLQGFNWGYGGEGCHGLIRFLQDCGVPFQEWNMARICSLPMRLQWPIEIKPPPRIGFNGMLYNAYREILKSSGKCNKNGLPLRKEHRYYHLTNLYGKFLLTKLGATYRKLGDYLRGAKELSTGQHTQLVSRIHMLIIDIEKLRQCYAFAFNVHDFEAQSVGVSIGADYIQHVDKLPSLSYLMDVNPFRYIATKDMSKDMSKEYKDISTSDMTIETIARVTTTASKNAEPSEILEEVFDFMGELLG